MLNLENSWGLLSFAKFFLKTSPNLKQMKAFSEDIIFFLKEYQALPVSIPILIVIKGRLIYFCATFKNY
jgi:hypothetical protein